MLSISTAPDDIGQLPGTHLLLQGRQQLVQQLQQLLCCCCLGSSSILLTEFPQACVGSCNFNGSDVAISVLINKLLQLLNAVCLAELGAKPRAWLWPRCGLIREPSALALLLLLSWSLLLALASCSTAGPPYGAVTTVCSAADASKG